jgi:arylsulfatase A-like enzyme
MKKTILKLSLLLMGNVILSNVNVRPNVLWIVIEDMSPHFGCYGENQIKTPHIDALAEDGVLFEHAYVTAPICSTSRSAMITGCYQTSIGAQHHRSGRSEKHLISLPKDVVAVPELFKKAGYWVCNSNWPFEDKKGEKIAKTDYNFVWQESDYYDGGTWLKRENKPFFAQIQLTGGKLRDNADKCRKAVLQSLQTLTLKEGLNLPPYYPSTPDFLEDWALTLDAVRYADFQVGEIIDALKKQGLYENTYIFLITDHGVSAPRGKQFLYDEGIHIPMIVRGPGLPQGQRRDDLIEHIDMAASSLDLVGITPPKEMHSRSIFVSQRQPRTAVFSARDRADETVDRLRCIRTKQYKYIQNSFTHTPMLQPSLYKDNKPCVIALRKAMKDNLLNECQKKLFDEQRPAEELYDLFLDPWEIHNLAGDNKYLEIKVELKKQLEDWEKKYDPTQGIEPLEIYEIEAQDYLDDFMSSKQVSKIEVLKKNIEWMKSKYYQK